MSKFFKQGTDVGAVSLCFSEAAEFLSSTVHWEHSGTKKDHVHFENEWMEMGKLHFKNKKAWM